MRKFSRLTLIAGAAALMTLTAGAELCRSVSATWESDTAVTRTMMWTTAIEGCKEIEHQTAATRELIYGYKAGIDADKVDAVRGVDCNCDLIADGEEGRFSAPPEGNGEQLVKICRGPIAEKKAETDPFAAFDAALKRGR